MDFHFATAEQSWNGMHDSNYSNGYGLHWWRCYPDGYRGDGSMGAIVHGVSATARSGRSLWIYDGNGRSHETVHVAFRSIHRQNRSDVMIKRQ